MLRQKNKLIEEWESKRLIRDKRVLEAFKDVAREDFILERYGAEVYYDGPLPIHKKQTISQPTTIVMMLDFLEVGENDKVLEIGAGSGYNAALLSRLTKNKIVSVERIWRLVEFAEENLKKSGVRNVEVVYHDGKKGYKKEAPYDRIIATCSSPYIHDAWKEQLKEGGVLVAPIGYVMQEMVIARKIEGELSIRREGYFSFVPLLEDRV